MANEIVISGTKKEILWAISEMPFEPETIYVFKGAPQGQKYSLNALNYCWQLMDKIAKCRDIKTSKEEVYLDLLRRVGVHTYIPMLPKDIPLAEAVYRIVIDRGETVLVSKSGKAIMFHTLECYKGLHLYDAREMSAFIDEVVSEAKELDIETDTPDEIARIKATWN